MIETKSWSNRIDLMKQWSKYNSNILPRFWLSFDDSEVEVVSPLVFSGEASFCDCFCFLNLLKTSSLDAVVSCTILLELEGKLELDSLK